MAEQEKPPSLDELDARLRAARARTEERTDGPSRGRVAPKGVMLGFRIGAELVVSVLVGGGIGWALDGWLGTRPWLMVLFLLLGGAAGVMGIHRIVKGADETVGFGAAQRRAEDDAKDH